MACASGQPALRESALCCRAKGRPIGVEGPAGGQQHGPSAASPILGRCAEQERHTARFRPRRSRQPWPSHHCAGRPAATPAQPSRSHRRFQFTVLAELVTVDQTSRRCDCLNAPLTLHQTATRPRLEDLRLDQQRPPPNQSLRSELREAAPPQAGRLLVGSRRGERRIPVPAEILDRHPRGWDHRSHSASGIGWPAATSWLAFPHSTRNPRRCKWKRLCQAVSQVIH